MFVGNTNCKLSMSLNSNTLPVVNEVKDLGVFVVGNLTFHSHIDEIVARDFIRSNLILECFLSRNVSTLVRVFHGLCSPHIGICFVLYYSLANQTNWICSKKFHETAAISYMYWL